MKNCILSFVVLVAAGISGCDGLRPLTREKPPAPTVVQYLNLDVPTGNQFPPTVIEASADRMVIYRIVRGQTPVIGSDTQVLSREPGGEWTPYGDRGASLLYDFEEALDPFWQRYPTSACFAPNGDLWMIVGLWLNSFSDDSVYRRATLHCHNGEWRVSRAIDAIDPGASASPLAFDTNGRPVLVTWRNDLAKGWTYDESSDRWTKTTIDNHTFRDAECGLDDVEVGTGVLWCVYKHQLDESLKLVAVKLDGSFEAMGPWTVFDRVEFGLSEFAVRNGKIAILAYPGGSRKIVLEFDEQRILASEPRAITPDRTLETPAIRTLPRIAYDDKGELYFAGDVSNDIAHVWRLSEDRDPEIVATISDGSPGLLMLDQLYMNEKNEPILTWRSVFISGGVRSGM